MQIKSIDLETTSISGQTVGMIKITLKAASAQYNFVATTVNDKFNANAGQFNGQCTSFREVGGERKTTNEVLFTYLKADDTNFNKIKKALLHLQALLNAEDDPFG
jgi:phage major head subunit gpT-like protein